MPFCRLHEAFEILDAGNLPVQGDHHAREDRQDHSERRGDGVAINIYGEQDMKIFESGVRYFQ